MRQHSRLCNIPVEILEHVALEVALADLCGSTASLTPLLCSCKYINSVLALGRSNALYARILKAKFDIGAPTRRFGLDLENEMLAAQLCRYYLTLQRIRRGDIFSPDILEIFWTSFLMLLDNDGKNRCQLDRVGFDNFVDRFVRSRMYENRWENNGWPADNAVNALALWLLWMTTTSEKLRAESEQRRQQIINIILPYVLLSFRFPTSQAPPNHLRFPLREEFDRQYPHSMLTAHGPFPLYREPHILSQDLHNFGEITRFSIPLISIAAKLLYFSRREILPFNIPSHLPLTRAHAMQLGRLEVGPTQADVIEFNAFTDTKLPPSTKWDWWDDLTEDDLVLESRGVCSGKVKSASAKWDNDWMRWAYCSNPWMYPSGKGTVYTPGTLTGLWQGRMIIPNELALMQLVSSADYPATFSESNPHVSTVPLYMRLREHHCISPQEPVNMGGEGDGFDDGFRSAYFPPMHFQQSNTHVVIEADGASYQYETYVEGRPNSHNEDTCFICTNDSISSQYEEDFAAVGLGANEDQDEEDWEDVQGICSGITDIIFTGETDLRHGQAWNHFTYVGRLRSWDGLIAILRIPRDRRLGKVIFYGYVIGGQNFVGNWRPAGADISAPAWESAFSMSRREE